MDNQIIDTEFNGQSSTILTPEAIGFLAEIRKWTKFLSILGFVFIGLMIILGFTIGGIISKLPNAGGPQLPTGIFTVIYIAMGAIYFFPVLYLFNFSNYLGKALSNNSSAELTKAFSNLKSHYKFIGILAIIVLCFYALALLGGIAGALLMNR